MKDVGNIVKAFKEGRDYCVDGRDLKSLSRYLSAEECESIGLEFLDGEREKHSAVPLTREDVLKQLKGDLTFGFEKALNKRGISASLMYQVVSTWNWILEEGLENFSINNYAQYGLPLFKATAVKYGFNNPIGDDSGNEYKYSEEGDY